MRLFSLWEVLCQREERVHTDDCHPSIPSLSLTSSWLACSVTCGVILSLGNYFSKETSLSIFSIDSKKISEKRWPWMRSGEREELSRVGNYYTWNFTKRKIRISSDEIMRRAGVLVDGIWPGRLPITPITDFLKETPNRQRWGNAHSHWIASSRIPT